MRRTTVVAAGFVWMCAMAGPLWAQAGSQASAGATGLEEIVVTARKREENLVDVPLSISAFSEAFLEKTGVDNLIDLANQTPGLSFRPAFGRLSLSGQGGGSSNRPTMRGQSNIIGTPNMGYFVDGVFVSGTITGYQLDNVERIEVIRGPQSALFGRSTFAGAVNFVTRKPGDTLAGKFEGTFGSFDRTEFSGYLAGPLLGETLKGEINMRDYRFGGDFVNRATGTRDNGESSRDVGAKLYWTPSEAFSLEASVGYMHDVDELYAGKWTGTNCLLPTIVTTTGTPRSSNRRRGYFCGTPKIDDTFFARWDIYRNLGLDGTDRETFRGSLKADVSFNDWTLTAIGAYNKFHNDFAADSGFEQGEADLRPASLTIGQERRKDWSAELRLDSPRDARLHWIGGAYYYKEQDGKGWSGVLTPTPSVTTIPLGANLLSLTKSPRQNDSSVKNWSVFGLLEFKASDRLNLTAEGRYQVDDITADQNTAVLDNVLVSNKFKTFVPRVTALYRLNDRWNLFANVAEGNKPGGFNTVPGDANAASRLDIITNFQTFDEESARTYELGLKGANESRTLSANVSVYQIDWKKQGLTRTILYTRLDNTPFTTPITVNAGRTRIRGLEIDLNAKPTESLDFRLAYSLVDSEILDFVDTETEDTLDTDGRVGAFNLAPGDSNGQVAGNQVAQSPKHQIILSGSYRRPFDERWTGFLRGDATYESTRYDQVANLASTGASTIMNLRTGLESDSWTITLYCTNLLDDDTPMSITRLTNPKRPLILPSRQNPAVTQTTSYRDFQVAYPRKRAYGLTASYKF